MVKESEVAVSYSNLDAKLAEAREAPSHKKAGLMKQYKELRAAHEILRTKWLQKM